MDSLFSFPVGLFHPLQHAGLSRRTTSRRRSTRRKGGAVAILRLNDLPPTGPGFLNSLIRIWGRRT